VPVIGIIENMSGMICPHCVTQLTSFPVVAEKTAEIWVSLFLRHSLDPEMVKAGDEGRRLSCKTPIRLP